MFKRRPSVETEAANASDRKFDHQNVSLLSGWIVTGCAVDGTNCAIGKGLAIEASSGLGILIVPDANRVLRHCMSFLSEADSK
jgi:hypothetical protein